MSFPNDENVEPVVSTGPESEGFSFTRATLKHRHAIWALAIAAAVFGTVAYLRMPVQLFPDTAPPIVNVVTLWPGASAEDVAEDLARPMEEAFASLEGIETVQSRSQDNLARVTLEFKYNRKVESAAVDVQNVLARIRGDLPARIREPQVLQFSTNDRPVITVGVGAASLSVARQQASDVLAARLQRVPGVAGVDVYGGAVDSVLVVFDPARLAVSGLTLQQIAGAIRRQNLTLPAGDLRLARSRSSLRLEARVDSLEALANLPLPAGPGKRVLLRDLATVRRGQLDDDASFAIDGKRAIAMAVYKTTEANTVAAVAAVTDEVARLQAEFPALSLRIGEESGSFAATSIANLISNVWQALALAAIIIFLFLGRVRASLVVALSMPLAYGITFGLMRVLGIEFNMVTLSAIILAVGMVVDAAVVVLENITRRRDEEGLSLFEAAVHGTDEVRLPVLAGVATTVIVLVPLLDLDGFIGKTFGPLAMTLLLAFVSSAAVALVLLPTLSLWLDGESRIDRWGERLTAPFQWLVDRSRDGYLWVLKRALRWRLVTMALAVVGMAVGLVMIRGQGMSVLPQMDSGSFFVSIQTTPGTSLAETRRVVAQVERIVAAQPEVVRVQSQAGFEPGMRSASSTGAEGPTQGFISATLSNRTDRVASIWDVEARVRDAVTRVPGIQSSTVRELGNTAKPTTSAPIVVQLSGDDPLVLDRLAETVLARLERVQGVLEPVRSWRLDQPRQSVKVDRQRASLLGLTPAAVAEQLNAGTQGVAAGDLTTAAGETLPVRLRYSRAGSDSPRDLLRFPIATPSGQSLPLREIAHLEPRTGQALVTREALAPTLEISAFASGRALSFILSDVETALADLPMPVGYKLKLSGEKDDLTEARSQLLAALAISILAVYLLLLAQLGSFLHPLTILMSVPLSLSGVGIALKLSDKPVSMPVMIGLILLVGTVVNNAIILIDFIRKRRLDGVVRQVAVLEAVATRFRPIMMTSLSTIIGMIPLAAEWALGAERFSPLAIAVIGGMTVATMLTLIVIPALYDLLDDVAARLAGLLRRQSAPDSVAGPVSRTVLWLAFAVGSLGVLAVAMTPATSVAAEPTTGRPGTAVSTAAQAPPGAQIQPAGGAAALSPGSTAAMVAPVPLTLARAQQLASRHSATLAGAHASEQAARDRHAEARARRLPSLDLGARYSRLSYVQAPQIKIPVLIPGMPAPPPMALGESIQNAWDFRATITQPIYLGGALTSAGEAAATGLALRQAQTQQARANLTLQVAQAWWGVQRLRGKADIAARAVRSLRARLDVVKLLQAGGRTRLLEVRQVAALVAGAETQRVQVTGQLTAAEVGLRSLLGLPATAHLHLSPPRDATTARAPELATDAAPAPELRIASLAHKVLQQRADGLRSQRMPTLVVRAGAVVANPNQRYFPVQDAFNGSWDVSVVASWKAWDWGRARHGQRAGEAEAAAALHRRREVARQLAVGLRVAHERLSTARTIAALSDAELRAREAALRVVVVEQRGGRATHTDVAEATLALALTASARVDATIDVHLAAAHLRRAGGPP